MNYSPEYKEAMLHRILPPNNKSITKIAKEEGISEQTLRNWRDKARKEGYAAPGKDSVSDDWSTQDKFLIVVESASLNETELAEYARKKGLYVEQITVVISPERRGKMGKKSTGYFTDALWFF